MVRSQARAPFSDVAQQWAIKSMQGELWAGSASGPQVLAGLQAQGVSLLLNMPRAAEYAAAPIASVWRTVEVLGHWVESDTQSRWLTVKVKTHERTDSGKIKVSTDSAISTGRVRSAFRRRRCSPDAHGTGARPGGHASRAVRRVREPGAGALPAS
jgi:hypothetical protein